MSASLSSLYVIALWLIALAVFFAAIHALAKSRTPGLDALTFLTFTSGWEGMLFFGALTLLLKTTDAWRDELDRANSEDSDNNRNNKDHNNNGADT